MYLLKKIITVVFVDFLRCHCASMHACSSYALTT